MLSSPLLTPVVLCLGSGRADAPAARALRISSLHKLLASLSLNFLINKMGVVTVPASQASDVSGMSQPGWEWLKQMLK